VNKDNKVFSVIMEMDETFSTEEKCMNYLEELRWAGKPHCPYCNNDKVYKFASGKQYKCASCKLVYSIRVGTIFEGSNLPLQKWFMALYLFVVHRQDISARQLAKDISIDRKSALFVLQRLRLCQFNIRAAASSEFEGALKAMLSVHIKKDRKKKKITRILKRVMARWK
jgi:transposase-like protein